MGIDYSKFGAISANDFVNENNQPAVSSIDTVKNGTSIRPRQHTIDYSKFGAQSPDEFVTSAPEEPSKSKIGNFEYLVTKTAQNIKQDLAPEEEGFFGNLKRLALQIPKAAGYVASFPASFSLDLLNLYMQHGGTPSYGEMKAQFPDLTREEYEKGNEETKQMLQNLSPSYWKAAEALEKVTGLPLEAKTDLQKNLLENSLLAFGAREPGRKIEADTGSESQRIRPGAPPDGGIPPSIRPGAPPDGGIPPPIRPTTAQAGEGQPIKMGSIKYKRPGFDTEFEFTKQEPRGPFAAGTEAKELATKKYRQLPIPQPFQIKTLGKAFEAKPIEEGKISTAALPKFATEEVSAESLGLKEIQKPVFKEKMPEEEVHDYVFDPITKFTVANKSKAGERLKNIFGSVSNYINEKVNSLYNTSRRINGSYVQSRDEFWSVLKELAREDRPVPAFGTNADVDKKINKILDSLVEVDKEGNIVKFNPVSNQEIIELGQDLRAKVQYNYAHDPSNVYYRIINAVDDEILRTAARNPKGYAAHIKAKNAYREWQENYNNAYIRPYLKASERDYIKLYNDLLSEDNFNVLHPILIQGGRSGKEFSRTLRREIVDNKIGKYISKLSDPSKAPAALNEIQKGLDELTIPLSTQEKRSIIENSKNIAVKARARKEARLAEEQQLQEYEISSAAQKRAKEVRVADIAKERTKKLTEKISKDVLKGKDPESIWKDMQSVSGMRRMEALVKKNNPASLRDFERLKKEAGIYKLYNGKIGEGKARSIESVLESSDNVEYLQATLGKDVVQKWQKTIIQKKNYDKRLSKYEKDISLLKKVQEKAATEAGKKSIEKTLKQKILEQAALVVKREVLSRSLDFLPYSIKAPLIEKILIQK